MTQPNERPATLTELVADEIRVAMTRRRMSGRDLARKLDVSPSWISYRLSGRQPIDLNDMFRIAKALGVGVHELLPPPEVVAHAADSSATVAYLPLAERLAITARPRDNRPPGRPSTPGSDGVGRTAYLSRSARRKTA
jgi:transcriptional regulator with XRE-family HTH domain